MEGTLLGIRSIALSQAYPSREDRPRRSLGDAGCACAGAARQAARMPTCRPASSSTSIFRTAPPDEVEGVTVAAQGKLAYGMWVEERADGRGFPYYWLRFGRETTEPRDGTDLHALAQRHISVTPLKLDLTAHEVRDQLTKALA